MRHLIDRGLVGPEGRPTPETSDYARAFDNNALNIEKLTLVLGFYFYILFPATRLPTTRLMQENDRRRVCYLQGFDFYGAFHAEEDWSRRCSIQTTQTMGFSQRLVPSSTTMTSTSSSRSAQRICGGRTAEQDVPILRGPMSRIIDLARSEPIRAFYVNANDWQDTISRLVIRMDFIVVYVSSLTPGVLGAGATGAEGTHSERDRSVRRGRHCGSGLEDSDSRSHERVARQQLAVGDMAGLSMPCCMRQGSERGSDWRRRFVVVSPDDLDAIADQVRNPTAEARVQRSWSAGSAARLCVPPRG